MTHQDKLDRWAERELARQSRKIILQSPNGELFAFGRYLIKRTPNGACVIKNDVNRFEFSNRATAMSWCVADNANRLNLARQIYQLDLNRSILEHDIHARRTVQQRSRNAALREAVSAKVSAKTQRLKLIKNQLTKLVLQTKYIQLQGLDHETQRTRRT